MVEQQNHNLSVVGSNPTFGIYMVLVAELVNVPDCGSGGKFPLQVQVLSFTLIWLHSLKVMTLPFQGSNARFKSGWGHYPHQVFNGKTLGFS